jgi:hypothetical protein
VVYLVRAGRILAYPYDLDQGEGYDLASGVLLAQGLPIYTDNQSFPYYSTNYPPLYAAAVAGAIAVWGEQLLAGRVVSLAATLGILALLFVAASVRAGALAGLLAGGFFLLSNYVFHVTPLARVNALAACLALAAVLLLGSRSRWALHGGVAALVAALLTKPTAIDAAAAGLLGATLVSRQRGLSAILGCVVGSAALAAALELRTQGAFSLNVLAGNLNPFLPGQLRDYLANFALLHAAPLVLAAGSVLQAARRGELETVHLFLLTGLLMALGVAKWGAGESYFLSAIMASSLLGGIACARMIREGARSGPIWALLILAQCAISAHGLVSEVSPGLPDRGLQAAALAGTPSVADLEAGAGIVERLAARDAPALVEDPGFLIAAGRPVVGNATHLRNLYQAGLWRPDNLVADLRERRYHTVVLDAELYPEPVLAAIGRFYFLYDAVDVQGARQKVFLPGTE